MKFCEKCGNTMEDNMNFCNKCGNQANTAENKKANEQRCLNRLSTGLKHERLCYKIYGIVTTITAALLILCSIFIFAVGGFVLNESVGSIEVNDLEPFYYDEYYDFDSNSDYYIENGEAIAGTAAGFSLSIIGGVYLGLGLYLAAAAIVNFVMMNKLSKYRNNLYNDCTAGANHANSVGSIILAAFFNEIALIFVIINFVFMKKNRATFEEIKATQKSYNNQ